MRQVKRLLGFNHAHLEHRRGSREQARDYCQKNETRIEGESPTILGTWIDGPGARTDIAGLKADLMSGMSMADVASSHFQPFLKYHKGIMLFRQLHAKARDFQTEIHLYVGPPGCGKSSYVQRNYPDAYWKPPQSKWWDNYHSQEHVVFDDFSGTWFSASYLLRLGDRYPLLNEVKGGHVNFCSRVIHITSNFGPRLWYKWRESRTNFDAFKRRVTKLYLRHSEICDINPETVAVSEEADEMESVDVTDDRFWHYVENIEY